MSLGRMSARAVTAEIGARPGEVAECTVRVRNDGPSPTTLCVRVHGLGQSSPYVAIAGPPLAPGAEVDVEVPLEVPETFGAGAHSLAIEIGSGRPEDRSGLAKVVLTIGAPAGITARIEPSVVRGGRRARFDVEVHNRNSTRADVTLQGSGPDLRVTLAHRQLAVDPGTTAVVRGKVRGPRRWVGDPAQHVVTVEARSGSIPLYTTASYRQRAVLPRRARGGMIGLAFVALWALIAAAVLLVWTDRDDPKDAGTEQTASGDSLTPLTLPDGSPASGGGADGTDGSGGGADGGGAAGGAADSDAASATIVRGTVKAGDTGADDGVLVTLTPTIPGEAQQVTAGDQQAALLRPGGPGDGMRVVPVAQPKASSDAPPTKFWPARYGTYRPGGLANLRTLSVASVASGADGSWQFQQVPLRQSYEVSFAKPGYTTQSFIVSPSDDGEPVELEVELAPGDGGLGGLVSGPSGAAEVTVTDGTLTFATTTSTDAGSHGRWEMDALSTPGTYTVTIASHGFGTEVMQVHLDPGETRTGLNIGLSANTGSIAGSVTASGAPRGGVTLVAAAGDETITTTSLTEGATGTYTFPQMALGSTYTVTASADGYITQTRSVTVDGNTTGIDFALVKSTASINGRVLSAREGTTTPLVSATVSVAAGDLQVRTGSAAAPDAGAFNVTDLPPGTYVLAASRYDHPEVSQLITLTAGQVFDAGDIVLTYQTRSPLTATGSLVVRTVKSDGSELLGATVQLIDIGGTIPTQSKTMAATEASVSFTAIPIGTYNVRVTKANYRPGTIGQLSIGLGPVERQVTMLQYGTARGTVVDAVGGYQYGGAPVYVTADDPETSIEFDVDKKLLVPPAEQVGPGAVAAYRTTNAAPLDGLLVVEYEGGLFVLDTNRDDVPDQPLTLLRVGARPLTGYELLLYRMSGTNPVCIGPIPAIDTEWEIDPTMQLLEGAYVLRFAPLPGEGAGTACAGRGQAPAGYAVIPSDAAGNVATFTVAENLDRKILLGPITVGPYTQISGRVLVPRVDTGAVVFDDFAAAQANDLSVVLDCDAAAGTAAATIAPGPGTAVTFTLTRAQVQALLGATPYNPDTGEIGNCWLYASYGASSEFIPTETPVNVAVGLVAPAYPDRMVSVALVDDPGIITGVVSWKDLGAIDDELPTHPVAGATVASVDDGDPLTPDQVIVGFTPSVENDPNDPDDSVAPAVTPGDERAAVATTADGSGVFTFAVPGERQVLGTSPYTVTGTPFATGDMSITAKPGDWSATGTPADSVVDNGSMVDVFLQPAAGALRGQATITSTRDVPPMGELAVTGTKPGATIADPPVAAAAGTYTIDPAAAGTWKLDYAADPAGNLLLTSASSARVFVDAGDTSTVAPPITAVELGQIDVTVVDHDEAAITAPGGAVTLTQQAGPATQPPTYSSAPVAPAGAVIPFRRLPVSAANAIGESITYRLSASIPNYDEPTSEVYVTRVLPNGSDGTTELVAQGDLSAIPITVRAGERVKVTLKVPAYATITGSLRGRTDLVSNPHNTEPLVTGTAGVIVKARRDTGATKDAVAVGVDGDYTIRVPAGTYTVEFSAPNYVSEAGLSVGSLGAAAEVGPVTANPGPAVPGLAAELELQTGTYNALVVESTLAGADAVEAATVQLFWGVYDPLDPTPPAATHTETTSATGTATIPNVYPGSYTVVIRKLSGSDDLNFPVIATVTIDRGPESTGSIRSNKFAMPVVGGSITGTVKALAASGGALALPAGLTVTRDYDLGQLVGPGFDPNTATEADLANQPDTSLPLTEATAGAGATYEFEALPYGDHELTFPDAAGFTLAPASPATVPVAGSVVHDVIYRAANVDLIVPVTDTGNGAAILDAAVTLSTTVPGQATPADAEFVDVADGTDYYRIAGVEPDLGAYTLHVEAEGYATAADRTITITPSATDRSEAYELTPVVTITGTAQREGFGSLMTPATSAVTLFNVTAGAVVTTATPDATGKFRFEVPAIGGAVLRVDVNEPGHKPVQKQVNTGNPVALRATYPVGTITTRAYASATITVTGVAAGQLGDLVLDLDPAATVSLAGSVFTVTNLDPDVAYTATVTHDKYADKEVFEDMTPAVGDTTTLVYTAAMVGKPATATITVSNHADLTNLALAVAPSGPSVTGPTAGVFSVTGLAPGTPYTFTLSADNHVNRVLTYTAEPKGSYIDTIALAPKPATATMSVASVTPAATNVALAVSAGGSPATGLSGTGGSGPWTVTGLSSGVAYTFRITSDNYTAADVVYTFGPGETKAFGAQPLTAKPVTATMSVASVTPAATNVALAVLAGGSPATGLSGTGGSGPWTVTGLSPGVAYTFRITSDNYTAADVVYTFGPGETKAFGAQPLTAKPATASITMGGAAAAVASANVTCAGAGVVGSRTPTTDTWVFTMTVGQSCTFTASATGYTSATAASAYVATPNGSHVDTLTPTLIVTP